MIVINRRDWFVIIRVWLRQAGVSLSDVARACHRDVKTVSNWADGGDPQDTDARTVMALLKKFCPDHYMKITETDQ